MASAPDEVFYRQLLKQICRGRVTPFLGAGVNLCGRPTDLLFTPGKWLPGQWLPSGRELARYLAREFSYPEPKTEADLDDLVRVAQWVSVKLDNGALYAELHDIFDRDYRPTAIHHTLARLPDYVRQRGRPEYPLFITTNYDDALEEALEDAGVQFDVLTYVATGEYRGRFRHDMPDGRNKVIRVANKYDDVSLQQRAVVVKIHGAVKRDARNQDGDSYVVTEDDYIECLTRTNLEELLPSNVVTRMQHCHYLFLGYSLRDWNLRAILHRIRRDGVLGNKSWAIQPNPDELELEAWERRNVEMLAISLEEFTKALDGYLVATDGDEPPLVDVSSA